MSRIGRKPVAIPAGVQITVADGQVTVKGPKGTLSQAIAPGVSVAVQGSEIIITRAGDAPNERAAHGLVRALVNNMVTGVSKGFERRLEIEGVGYKCEVKGQQAHFTLGYSHPVIYDFPPGITVDVDKNVKISVKGISKQMVGQAAADIRSLREPDSYKGKGIRYEGEVIRLKAGKTGAK